MNQYFRVSEGSDISPRTIAAPRDVILELFELNPSLDLSVEITDDDGTVQLSPEIFALLEKWLDKHFPPSHECN